jgi:hypothetical protein
VHVTRARWRKSSYSSANGGSCVEVARGLRGIVAVRDSKNPDGPALPVSPRAWGALTDQVKDGAFDLR